jgi:hypothetical protein
VSAHPLGGLVEEERRWSGLSPVSMLGRQHWRWERSSKGKEREKEGGGDLVGTEGGEGLEAAWPERHHVVT